MYSDLTPLKLEISRITESVVICNVSKINGFSAKIEEQWPLDVFKKQLEAAITLPRVLSNHPLFNASLHLPGAFQIQVSKYPKQHSTSNICTRRQDKKYEKNKMLGWEKIKRENRFLES